MPKRPRQHQLEGESRTAFRVKLPPEWVFRESVPDYGVDGEVEIFDKSGLSTGHIFFVQLKATDKPDLDRALAISFQIETCKYYRSLDLPVLIVLFYAPTRKLYAKWFHTFDPYYAKKGRKYTTFRFNPEDVWGDETPENLASDVEAIKQITSPQIALPVSFSLILGEPEIHGVSAAQIGLEIRKVAARLPAYIAISGTPPPHSHPSIVVTNKKTMIDLAGVGGFTLHTSKGYPVEDALSKYPYDVLIGVAIALDQIGHSNPAAQLVREYAEKSSIITHPKIVWRIAGCMARAHRLTDALQLSEKLFENEESLITAQALLVPVLDRSDSLSSGEREYLLGFLHRCIERAEQAGDRTRMATAHYNLGNLLRGWGKLRLALYHYRKAIDYDPEYLDRPYFWKELGGILFLNRRYRLSARFYERAINLGERGLCRALYADALMFTGKYRESQEAFDAYLKSVSNDASEWRLKAWVLHGIRRRFGLDEQKRQIRAAKKIVPSPAIKLSPDELRAKLEEALRHDALCDLAWFNLGALEGQAGNRDEAFISFLMAALILNMDVEAWCNAMALGMSSEEYVQLVPDIIAAAYWINGEGFFEQVVRLAQSQPASFPTTEFLNMINEVLSLLPKKRSPFEMRWLRKGSDYEVIKIPRARSEPENAL